jgi:hypothetical protein
MVGLAVLALAFIPDLFGRIDFWGKNGGAVLRYLVAHGNVTVMVICTLVIIVDYRRVQARGKRTHDPRTLKGRTEQLKDDLEAFVNGLGEKPALQYNGEMNSNQFEKANSANLLWFDRLQYGYLLRFQERVKRLYFEYGECGKAYLPLSFALEPGQVEDEKGITEIISMLGEMAKTADLPAASIPKP